MKKICFFMGISSNLAFAAANVAIGLNKHNVGLQYDIVIYYSEMSDSDLNAFKSIPNCKLIKFTFDDDFTEFMLKRLPDECRFKDPNKLMCFTHYEAFKLLDEYKYVVWLEPDMLIQESLEGIEHFSPLGFQQDGEYTVGDQFVKRYDKKEFKMDVPAIRIGIMVFDNTLPYMQLYRWCYEKSYEVAPFVKNPEQAVFNLMIQEFDLVPQIIPDDWHAMTEEDAALVSRIVHFGTERKIWNTYEIFDMYPEWYRNSRIWANLNGSVSDDFTLSNAKPINKLKERALKHQYPIPFDRLMTGSKVIIYGAGKVGQLYYNELLMYKDIYEVVAVVDRTAKKTARFYAIEPYNLSELEYDYVLVAIGDIEHYEDVISAVEGYGVKKEQLIFANRKYDNEFRARI